MWLSHTREESPDTRQEGGGAGPVSPRRALQGAAGMPALSGRASQMRQGPDRGDRPSGPGHGRTTPSREHCASGRRVGRGRTAQATGPARAARHRDSDPVVHRSQGDGTRGHAEDDDRLARFATAGCRARDSVHAVYSRSRRVRALSSSENTMSKRVGAEMSISPERCGAGPEFPRSWPSHLRRR